MTAANARPDVVRVDNICDAVTAIPFVLGYRPRESVVAVALVGKRSRRLGFTLRLDLDPADRSPDDVVARDIGTRMAGAGAGAVLLCIYSSRAPSGGELPYRELVDRITDGLAVPLLDAVLVGAGRVWSYLCDVQSCCPAEGRVIRDDTPGATALAAVNALHGNVVLPDREAVVATTRAVEGVAARSMHQALHRAIARLDGDASVTNTDGGVRWVEAVRVRYCDPPAALTHDEAAELTLRLHHVPLRDVLLQRLARGDEALELLLREVSRLAQPPADAPAAAMLSAIGYLRGDGVVAVAAAERALDSDAGYSLAGLILDAVDAQLHPRELRALWSHPL